MDSSELPARPDSSQLKAWIVQRIARELSVSAEEIDPSAPMIRYGLESVAAVGISGELEQALGRRLPPTLLLDASNIDELVEDLVEILAEPDPGS